MLKLIFPILVGVALVTPAFAQTNTDSNSDAASSAQNSLIFEGSRPSAASASIGGAMHTAPCIIGHGQAIGVVGLSLANTGGDTEPSCLGRAEAEWIIKLLGMQNGLQKRAAIFHACTNIPSIRKTLISINVCEVATR
jgi:hypothetical protein